MLQRRVVIHGVSESSWLATVSTEGGKITFILDTGAKASVLPLKVQMPEQQTSHCLVIRWVDGLRIDIMMAYNTKAIDQVFRECRW